MSLPKRTQIKIVITIAVAILFMLTVAFVGWAFLKTRNTCHTFQIFGDDIRQKNWQAAQTMVSTNIEPRWFRIETNAVYYWDHDMTMEFSSAQPLFKRLSDIIFLTEIMVMKLCSAFTTMLKKAVMWI
jgi:hypothetical protein